MEFADAGFREETLESLNVGSGVDNWGDVRLDFAKNIFTRHLLLQSWRTLIIFLFEINVLKLRKLVIFLNI
jgi:hypothetical protein